MLLILTIIIIRLHTNEAKFSPKFSCGPDILPPLKGVGVPAHMC